MSIADRLKQARIAAGFKSAAETAVHFGWAGSTYASHENGTRGVHFDDVTKYATAFRVDRCFLAFGDLRDDHGIGGVPRPVLRQIIEIVMNHEAARSAPPEIVAGLIVDLCDYATKAPDGNVEGIVDFSLTRTLRQAQR